MRRGTSVGPSSCGLRFSCICDILCPLSVIFSRVSLAHFLLNCDKRLSRDARPSKINRRRVLSPLKKALHRLSDRRRFLSTSHTEEKNTRTCRHKKAFTPNRHVLPSVLTSHTTSNQQQPPDLTDSVLPETWILLLLPGADGSGAVAILFLISPAIVINASSTFVAFFAEVSRKGMLT